MPEMSEKRILNLSLDYDCLSRGCDESFEYTTEEEREELISGYIFHHEIMIADMAGVEHISEINDPEDFLDVSDEEVVEEDDEDE